MANYVNEVKKDNVLYDIQDKRLQVTAEDAGKMVSVNEQGELTLVPAPSGGTKLYQHNMGIYVKSGYAPLNYVLSFINSNPTPYYGVDGGTMSEEVLNELETHLRIASVGIWGVGRYMEDPATTKYIMFFLKKQTSNIELYSNSYNFDGTEISSEKITHLGQDTVVEL